MPRARNCFRKSSELLSVLGVGHLGDSKPEIPLVIYSSAQEQGIGSKTVKTCYGARMCWLHRWVHFSSTPTGSSLIGTFQGHSVVTGQVSWCHTIKWSNFPQRASNPSKLTLELQLIQIWAGASPPHLIEQRREVKQRPMQLWKK